MVAGVDEKTQAAAERRGNRRVYDLSVPFCRDMPTYYFYKNVFSPPMFSVFSQIEGTPLGEWSKDAYVTHVSFLTHIGTHVDAPRHFRSDGWYLHEIPPDRWFGEGPVLSIPKGPKEDITAADLENAGLEVRPGDIVAINTGWHHKYTGPAADRDGAISYMETGPGLCAESAQWLADHGIVTVMIDGPAIDSAAHMPYGDGTMQSHTVLFRYNIPAVEGLGGELDLVTGKRCLFSVAPLKYVNGDAFPLRALAIPLE
ncbi:MAG TPA: cyclase family protein [Chloroflexota bacterium]|nr:cyclase family protein [Chloroflexota bacterium]